MFSDLAPETISKKKELKEIIAVLRDANIRFRWATPLTLHISHKMHFYFINNKDSGLEVLHLLKLLKPPRSEQLSKRKLHFMKTPPKDFKKTPWD